MYTPRYKSVKLSIISLKKMSKEFNVSKWTVFVTGSIQVSNDADVEKLNGNRNSDMIGVMTDISYEYYIKGARSW